MSLEDERVLITGAAGFIGSHLGNALRSVVERVVGIDNWSNTSDNPREFDVVYGDVTRKAEVSRLVKASRADAVVHLAALISVDESVLNPRAMIKTNVEGTLNVLEVARKQDIRVVFASSSEVYGTAQRDSIAESHPLDAQSPYAATKVAGDRMCKAWADTYGLEVNIVRGFNTYGPYQNPGPYGGVIAKFVRQCLAGEPMTIYGDGKQLRDFMSVDDSVSAYVLALRRKFPGPVNFGTGQVDSVLSLARVIASKLGRGETVHLGPRPGDVRVLRADNSLARSLGWRPMVRFEDGISRYIEWAIEWARS